MRGNEPVCLFYFTWSEEEFTPSAQYESVYTGRLAKQTAKFA